MLGRREHSQLRELIGPVERAHEALQCPLILESTVRHPSCSRCIAVTIEAWDTPRHHVCLRYIAGHIEAWRHSPSPWSNVECSMLQFSVRNRDVLMNARCPHKWWSTLKSAVFGSCSDSSLPLLIGAGGGLVCESVGKADSCRSILMESSPGIQ